MYVCVCVYEDVCKARPCLFGLQGTSHLRFHGIHTRTDTHNTCYKSLCPLLFKFQQGIVHATLLTITPYLDHLTSSVSHTPIYTHTHTSLTFPVVPLTHVCTVSLVIFSPLLSPWSSLLLSPSSVSDSSLVSESPSMVDFCDMNDAKDHKNI